MRTLNILLAAALTFTSAIGSLSAIDKTPKPMAKRAAPRPVAPVTAASVTYSAPAEAMGFVIAADSGNGKELWRERIYSIRLDPDLERDVQDVFITSLTLKGAALLVANERGEIFSLDLATRKVAAQKPIEARGIDRGGDTLKLYVARDRAAWDKVKGAVGKPQMLPIGMATGDDLGRLDGVDFEKQMIVAVAWGKMNFSVQKESCWIEGVSEGGEAVLVDCRASLWGGAVDASYRAWPYHARVVPRSDLPVRFVQTTELQADPGRSEKGKVLATLSPDEWEAAPVP